MAAAAAAAKHSDRAAGCKAEWARVRPARGVIAPCAGLPYAGAGEPLARVGKPLETSRQSRSGRLSFTYGRMNSIGGFIEDLRLDSARLLLPECLRETK